jgi:hypothetical protein
VDAELRRLERRAASGDPEARGELVAAYLKAGRLAEAYVLVWDSGLDGGEVATRVVAAQRDALRRLHAARRSSLLVATGRTGRRWSWSEVRSLGAGGHHEAPILAARLGSALSRERFDALLELRTLVEVDATSCKALGDKRVAELCRLPRLRTLRLAGTRATDGSLRAAARATSLQVVDLRGDIGRPPSNTTRGGVAQLVRARPDLRVRLPRTLFGALEDAPLSGLMAVALGVTWAQPDTELRDLARQATLTLLESEGTATPDVSLPLLEVGTASADENVRAACALALSRLVELGGDPGSALASLVGALSGVQGRTAARVLRTAILAGREVLGLRERLASEPPPSDGDQEDYVRKLRDLLAACERHGHETVAGLSVLDPHVAALVEWALARDDLSAQASALARAVHAGEPWLEDSLPLVRYAVRSDDASANRLATCALWWLGEANVDLRPLYPDLPTGAQAPAGAEKRGLLHSGEALATAGLAARLASPRAALTSAQWVWDRARRGDDLTRALPVLRQAATEASGAVAFYLTLALHHHAWRHPDGPPPPPVPAPGDPRPKIDASLPLEPGNGRGYGAEWTCKALWEAPQREAPGGEPSPETEAPRACAACGSLATVCTYHFSWSGLSGSLASWDFACDTCGCLTNYDYQH